MSGLIVRLPTRSANGALRGALCLASPSLGSEPIESIDGVRGRVDDARTHRPPQARLALRQREQERHVLDVGDAERPADQHGADRAVAVVDAARPVREPLGRLHRELGDPVDGLGRRERHRGPRPRCGTRGRGRRGARCGSGADRESPARRRGSGTCAGRSASRPWRGDRPTRDRSAPPRLRKMHCARNSLGSGAPNRSRWGGRHAVTLGPSHGTPSSSRWGNVRNHAARSSVLSNCSARVTSAGSRASTLSITSSVTARRGTHGRCGGLAITIPSPCGGACRRSWRRSSRGTPSAAVSGPWNARCRRPGRR